MATLTLYSPEAEDGYVESSSATYGTMQAGSALSADNTLTWRDGQTLITGTYYGFQGFIKFDTSGIGPSGTINSATLSLFTNDKEATEPHTHAVAAYDWSSGGLTTADWRDATALAAMVDVATLTSGATTEGVYNSFSDTGPGLASVINKTGSTYLILYTTRQKAGTFPTVAEFIIWEGGGTASPAPKLVIDYTPGVLATDSYNRRGWG